MRAAFMSIEKGFATFGGYDACFARTLNLGILAHVDAGKTTLTERLLYAAGVIDEIGSVDDGTTQTDSLALERQRGITIKSAVVSFAIDDVTVNLIDTPGHPDFIAEVERVLSVLDGAVLVISAVEGVQPQTRVLMRALQRLRVPTLIFVNKIDRAGADDERVLRDDRRAADARDRRRWERDRARHPRRRLHAVRPPTTLPSGQARRGARRARRRDPGRVRRRRGRASRTGRLRGALAAQTQRALVHPVFFGSAITGAGVDAADGRHRRAAARRDRRRRRPRLRARCSRSSAAPAGEKIAYVRMFSGTRADARPACGSAGERRGEGDRDQRSSTAGRPTGARRSSAGEIAKLWGLAEVQIGDAHRRRRRRPRPSVSSRRRRWSRSSSRDRPTTAPRLRVALAQLAEQDPLINVRQDDDRARDLRLALRRGAEGGDPGDARATTSASTSRSARRRRSASSGRPARARRVEILHADVEPVPADDRAARRPGAGRLGHRVPARRRPADDAALRLQDRRRLRRRDGASTSGARCTRACSAGRSPTAS